MTRPVDVVVVGAGPCGLAAAIALESRGLSAVAFDGRSLVSAIAGYPTYMTFFSTAERISIAGIPFPAIGEKPTRREALAYYRAVARHFDVKLRLYEPVTEVHRLGNRFRVVSVPQDGSAREMDVGAVVMATGYFDSPNLLGVPGESLPHVSHRFREGHEAFGRRVVVVGGGNSAVDAALELYRSGAHVTMVHFGPGLDRNVKPWILPDIANRISEGSVGARWDARVARITPTEVIVRGGGGEERLAADHVYLMTGYTPTPTLLRGLGVTIHPDTGVPAHDPATMESDVPGVYIAGVIASGNDANRVFIENGRGHGDLIAAHLAERLARRDV